MSTAAQEIMELRAKLAEANAKLAAPREIKLTLKVSEKGALSIYGMGRFPVTLYKEQWNAVLNAAEPIRAFIQANDARLKSKERD